MALLRGKDASGDKWLKLYPIPQPGEDASEYAVEFLTQAGGPELARRFSVAGWLMEHNDLLFLARTLAQARALLGATVPLRLSSEGSSQPAAVYEALDWLKIVVWGSAGRGRLAIQLFVQEPGESDLFRPVFLNASVEDVVQFGLDLEREIGSACPAWFNEYQAPPD